MRRGAKRRLTVHVGTAKAGSTSIQNLLAVRWRRLARAGVHVPFAGAGGGPPGAHHGLARELLDPLGAAGHWAGLERELGRSAAARFAISCEAFTGPAHRVACAERLQALAERGALEIDVVGYVRPQWQWLESGYAEQVRTGGRGESFDAFVARMLAAGPDTRLDYNTVFAPFREAFGDRVRVYAVERSRLPAGVARHFLGVLGVLGVDAAAAAGAARANARLGAKELEVRRRAARLAGDHAARTARKLLWLPALLDDDAPFAGFDGDRIEGIEGRFADANGRFARAYGIGPDGVLFRDPVEVPGRRRNVACWEALDAAERRRVRRYVLDRIGVDVGVAADAPATGRGAVLARLALRGPGVAAPLAAVRLATTGFRARRAWARLT